MWLQFSSEIFQTFLNDARLYKFCGKYFGGQNCQFFILLFAKDMKGWSGKFEILCAEQFDHALQNTRKQHFYLGSPSVCKYRQNIFKGNILKKIFGKPFERNSSTGPHHFTHMLSRACWNWKSVYCKLDCAYQGSHFIPEY